MTPEKNILLVSNEPWGDIWFSKHHYASELSRNHNVYFIDPPLKWSISNLWNARVEFNFISDKLTVIRYKNFLPHYFLKWNNRVVTKRIYRKLKSEGVHPDWFWSFDPQRLFSPIGLGVQKTIFHVVDKYRFAHPAELIFHRNVDGFVLVSDEFRKQYEHYGKPMIHITHGISGDEFEGLEQAEAEVPFKEYILFAGNVDLRLDYELIYKMAQELPGEKFIFLGGLRKVDDPFFRKIFENKELKNVIYVPAVHAKKLKFWMQKSKCCLAPMRQDIPGNMISHHKILQYMAHGKAVFSPEFSAYLPFQHLLYMNNDYKLQIASLKLFLEQGEDPDLMNERKVEACKNLYDNHIKMITAFIQGL